MGNELFINYKMGYLFNSYLYIRTEVIIIIEVFSVFNIYFSAYIHLWFKHAVVGTHLNCLGCLSRTVS